MRPRKAADDGSGTWVLLPMWETQMELLVPGFSTAQPWLLGASGEWASEMQDLSNATFQIKSLKTK